MIFYKFINKKNFFKIAALSVFFLLLPIEASPSSSLNKMRVSYDGQTNKIRIVFDGNKKINYIVKDRIR